MDFLIKPSPIFALIKIFPLLLLTTFFLVIATKYCPSMIWISILLGLFSLYRLIYIRHVIYLVTTQYIRVSRGLFFKRVDTIELFRVKDYIVTEPFLLQLFRLMDVHLKTTDPENPILWITGIPQSDLIDIIRSRVLETRKRNVIYELN